MLIEHDFIDIGSRMAQELRDFVDEAEQAGNENALPGVKALINEWETIYRQSQLCLQDIDIDDLPLPTMLTRQSN